MLRFVFNFAKKEIFSNLYSVRFIFTMDLICVLFLASCFMMISDYRNRRDIYEARSSSHKDALNDLLKSDDSPDSKFSDLFHREGFVYDREPIAMGILVRGLDYRAPNLFQKSNWEEKQSNDDSYRNPILKLYMNPDFAYIVNIVLSLLALLFVFDTICGEKEAGTLKLGLSYPVPKITVLLGKWIGGFATLMFPVFMGVLFWMVIVSNSGEVAFSMENTVRFLSIIGTSILYVCLFFSLGMFVSCLTHYSNTSLLICFFIWVIWIMVIPNAAPVVAKVISPVPSRNEIQELKEAVDKKTREKIKEAEKNALSYLDEIEDIRDEIRAQGEFDKNEIEAFYRKKVDQQSRTAGLLARLSPSGSYVFAVTSLAGTGIETYHSVFKSYEQFKSDFDKSQNQAMKLVPKGGRRSRWGIRGLPADWMDRIEMPKMSFPSVPLDEVFDNVMLDLLLLFMFNVLFFMLSFLAFLVYDPK